MEINLVQIPFTDLIINMTDTDKPCLTKFSIKYLLFQN